MDPKTTIAVTKAIQSKDSKAARAELAPGKYNINAMVMIDGELSVGEDETQTAKSNIITEEFVVLALHHAGVTRDNAVKIIKNLSDASMVNWTGTKEAKKEAKKARAAKVKEYDPEGRISGVINDLVAKLPRVSKKGKVSFAGQVEMVEAVPMGDVVRAEEDAASAVAAQDGGATAGAMAAVIGKAMKNGEKIA